MTMETLIFDTLRGLVADRVYPGVAPDGVGDAPYITWSIGGGQPVNFVDGSQPSKGNGRLQINVWSKTVMQTALLAQQAETALRGRVELSTTVLTQRFTRVDEVTKRHGTYQFFSCWADIPA
ncbi:DUF3168 domain-containing protein [Duganella sp. CT11-25]|uniref:tail completion protein gp17 n=1 Tax=unclassified Duganella TaxID=2636909 RepID=UPI0039AEDF88